MARKSAIHVTAAEIATEEFKADERRDSAEPEPSRRGLLPNLAEIRKLRGQMTPLELLETAKSAVRLELGGSKFSADDKADVASEVMRRVLVDTGGAMPGRESERVSLNRLCMDCKNLRRSLLAQREHETAEELAADAERANLPLAMGVDPMPADAASIVARSSVQAAKLAAAKIARDLDLPDNENSPVWSILFQWARGETGDICAAELGVKSSTWRMRQTKGAKIVHERYSAAQLGAALTLGASETSGEVRLVVADRSSEAPHKWATDVAEYFRRETCWREPHYDRADSRDAADAVCTLSRQSVRPKRERERARKLAERASRTATYIDSSGRLRTRNVGDSATLRADSLKRLGQALGKPGARGKSSPADSLLSRSLSAGHA